ncbi:MAG: hypothetical protein ACM3JI_04330, partial [Anaerolineae bacterium]
MSLKHVEKSSYHLLTSNHNSNLSTDSNSSSSNPTLSLENHGFASLSHSQVVMSQRHAVDLNSNQLAMSTHSKISAMFLFEKTLLIGTASGSIQAICAKNSQPQWTVQLPGTVTGMPRKIQKIIHLEGHFFAILDDFETLHLIDAQKAEKCPATFELGRQYENDVSRYDDLAKERGIKLSYEQFL